MKREIYRDLLKWKNSKNRKPLLLQGVRQCGKTYILKEFGRENYDDVAYFTFEDNPDLHETFQKDLDTKRILDYLSFARNKKIEPGKTLIIFDEIQLCSRALTSLKFFCENAPQYHLACAGSLLGVMLSKPGSFPVGKVRRLMMFPMTFKEFLLANSEDLLVEHMENNGPTEALPLILTNKLNTYLDYFFLTGGMPAAVASWIAERDVEEVDTILGEIIKDYADDFSKHASDHLAKLTLIWSSIPAQLARENRKFVFGHVKKGARAKDLEDALEWLVDAGLIYKVKRTDRPKVPLSMHADSASFKIYMADIGILRKMAKIPSDFLFSKNKEYDDFRGAVTENYVLTELISLINDVPYYWKSDHDAEVDFVAQIGGMAIPIEAKAGSNRSKSLAEYIRTYDPEVAVTTAARRNMGSVVKHIPLYSLWKIGEYVTEMKRLQADDAESGSSAAKQK
ncbi:MAG: ATP-binding protein [Methanomassiliicoccaceae archaeon]|nr:ATP-binding protein [Methanomassiliicoccaceae archaeon]